MTNTSRHIPTGSNVKHITLGVAGHTYLVAIEAGKVIGLSDFTTAISLASALGQDLAGRVSANHLR